MASPQPPMLRPHLSHLLVSPQRVSSLSPSSTVLLFPVPLHAPPLHSSSSSPLFLPLSNLECNAYYVSLNLSIYQYNACDVYFNPSKYQCNVCDVCYFNLCIFQHNYYCVCVAIIFFKKKSGMHWSFGDGIADDRQHCCRVHTISTILCIWLEHAMKLHAFDPSSISFK